jgi:hypothetical protein
MSFGVFAFDAKLLKEKKILKRNKKMKNWSNERADQFIVESLIDVSYPPLSKQVIVQILYKYSRQGIQRALTKKWYFQKKHFANVS